MVLRGLGLLMLALALCQVKAQVDYDEEPDAIVKSSKEIIVQWEKRSSGCSSSLYRVYARVGGTATAAQTAANGLTSNSWNVVFTSGANVLTTTLTGLLGCGTSYEFRIDENCDSAGYGDLGPASDPVFTPACYSGASGEQCGVRSNGDYSCLASSTISYSTDLANMGFQSTQTSGDSSLIRTYINLNFASITTGMWLEPGFENAFAKALGESLEDLTSMEWVNASTYVGDLCLCSDTACTSAYGCTLGSSDTGVSVGVTVDCGFNSECATTTTAALQLFSTTDSVTSQTYADDFLYRLLYYMTENTYDYLNLPEDTTYATTYSGYNTLTYSDLTIGVPTSSTISTLSVNPLTSSWMPSLSVSGAAHTLWSSFEYPCGINREGTAECVGYYDQWANSSNNAYKVSRTIAPAYRQRKFKMISTDMLRTCGITHEDRLICWGHTDFGSYTESANNLIFPCGFTEHMKSEHEEYEIEINQNDGLYANVVIKWRWNWISVGGGGISGSTYTGTVCGVRQDGKGFCFGCNEALGVAGNLQETMPDIDDWQKIEVSPDGTWACGWVEDGQARCWGQTGVHPIIPEGIFFRDIPSIVGSTNHVACGLQSSDGKLLCYGHYLDSSNKRHEIARTFSAGTLNTYGATADTNTASGFDSSTNILSFSKWGCAAARVSAANSAVCVQSWDGWDGVGTTQTCTEASPGTLSGGTISGGAYSGTTDFNFVQAPGVPYYYDGTTFDDDPVATASTSGKSATIQFYPPYVTSEDFQEPIVGYQVYVKGGARRRRRRASKYKMKWMVANALAANTASTLQTLTVTGLLPDEKYKFKLRAFSTRSGYRFGRLSSSSNTIYTPKAVPDKIEYFWWSEKDSADDYVMLEWLTPPGSGLDYDVTYFQVNHKLSTASTYTATSIYPRTNYDLTESEWIEEWFNGLTGGTTYNFNVAACNDNGCGTATSDITATTNYTETHIAYTVKSNMTVIAQWCGTYGVDCGNWITTNTWTEDMADNFLLTLVYWLQYHSTYMIEYHYAYEAYTAVSPTPAPSLGAVGDVTTAVPGLTTVSQVDWENSTAMGQDCTGGASTGCYQPTAQPTERPVVQISNDGYFNDEGALNGSATGDHALTTSDCVIDGETDMTYTVYNTTNDGTTTSAETSTSYDGINVDYTVTTATEAQADTVLAVTTENQESTSDTPDTMTFGTAFAQEADTTYSAYTGSENFDSTDGAYESKASSTDNTGIWIALLAAVVVILCLVIFILHGWYKRHQLKKYLERRGIVQSRFQKATATIGQMRRLGNLTAILKANENAFSYQNLKDTHKDYARSLKDVYNKASTDANYTQANEFDDAAEIQRLKDEYTLSQEYLDANASKQRRLLEEQINRRKAELRARRQGSAGQDKAVRERVEKIVEDAAEDQHFKILTLDSTDQDELERLKKEVEQSSEYLACQESERRALMQQKLDERRKKLIDSKQNKLGSGDKVLDPEIVDTIMDRASAALVQQLQAEAFDEEAELARLKSEYERSAEYMSAQESERKALMREKLDARKAAIRTRQAEQRQASADSEELGAADGMTPQLIEIAQIVEKVEANVADACDAKEQAAAILGQFKEAEADSDKNSAEARQRKKEALQARLKQRREAKAKVLADLEANTELSEAEKSEARADLIDLPEKWQEVEDDLVEQALCTYELELENQSLEQGADAVTDRAQEIALAKVMWQLDRDMAHAEELRNNEWASSEAANILKKYDQASKKHESDVKTAQSEQRNALKKRLEKRRMLRVKNTASNMWSKIRTAKPHETTTMAKVIHELEGRETMDL